MPTGVLDALLEGAAERDALTLREDAGSRARWEKWEKLNGAIGGLGPGRSHVVHPGLAVRRGSSGGFEVTGEDGIGRRVPDVGTAEKVAKEKSAKSTHKDSLGGATSHPSVGEAEKAEKGAPRYVYKPLSRDKGSAADKARAGEGLTAEEKKLPSGPRTLLARARGQGKSRARINGGTERTFAIQLERLGKGKVKGDYFVLAEEAGPGGRPGTNWTQVSPDAKKKLAPLVRHYMAKAHPFTECVRDQIKHGLSEQHAKGRCAVVKDIGSGGTGWRKGGKTREQVVEERIVGAAETLAGVDAALGQGAASQLAEGAPEGAPPLLETIAEACFEAMGQLYLAGWVEPTHATRVQEDAGTRARWEKWEKTHPGQAVGVAVGSYGDLQHGRIERVDGEHVYVKKAAELGGTEKVHRSRLRKITPADARDLKEAAGDFDAGALLAKVRAAPTFRETAVPPKQVILPGAWNVIGPPDDPNIFIEPGGVIEDDRTGKQKRQGFGAANAFRAAAKAKTASGSRTRSAAPSATPSGLTGGGSTSRERWAKWEKVNQGKSGEPVQGVQAAVGVKTDGVFGSKTQAAVRRFQQKNGLQVDGVVGRQTYAAFAGRKGASKIKVGKLNTRQVSHLAAFSRHGGTLLHPRRRKLHASSTDAESGSLQEAMLEEAERATIEEFPGRVRDLRLGEVTRLPDGTAVRYVSTLDGRGVYQVGTPSSYGEAPGDVRYWDSGGIRTPEEVITRAALSSAGRTDPESIGGPDRYSRYGSLRYGGRDVTLVGVTPDLRPIVRASDNLLAAQQTVTWAELTGRSRLLEEAPLGEMIRHGTKSRVDDDPRGKHKRGHVVRFERALRANRTQDDVSTRPGVITGFHKQSHDPIIKDLANNIERVVPRRAVLSTHGPLSSLGHVSNWAKWNKEHPERSHGRRLADAASGVADAPGPFCPAAD